MRGRLQSCARQGRGRPASSADPLQSLQTVTGPHRQGVHFEIPPNWRQTGGEALARAQVGKAANGHVATAAEQATALVSWPTGAPSGSWQVPGPPNSTAAGRGAFKNRRDETAVDGPWLARAGRARGAGCPRLRSCVVA